MYSGTTKKTLAAALAILLLLSMIPLSALADGGFEVLKGNEEIDIIRCENGDSGVTFKCCGFDFIKTPDSGNGSFFTIYMDSNGKISYDGASGYTQVAQITFNKTDDTLTLEVTADAEFSFRWQCEKEYAHFIVAGEGTYIISSLRGGHFNNIWFGSPSNPEHECDWSYELTDMQVKLDTDDDYEGSSVTVIDGTEYVTYKVSFTVVCSGDVGICDKTPPSVSFEDSLVGELEVSNWTGSEGRFTGYREYDITVEELLKILDKDSGTVTNIVNDNDEYFADVIFIGRTVPNGISVYRSGSRNRVSDNVDGDNVDGDSVDGDSVDADNGNGDNGNGDNGGGSGNGGSGNSGVDNSGYDNGGGSGSETPPVETPYVPGGTDLNIPPNTTVPGRVLVSDGVGYLELDDDGVPMGKWEWDEDEGLWIFDEYTHTPLSSMPSTGDPGSLGYYYLSFFISIIGLYVVSKLIQRHKKRYLARLHPDNSDSNPFYDFLRS